MKKTIFSCFLVVISLIAGQAAVKAGEQLEQYLKIELNRLEETYRVMDRFAEEIWPGWDNYDDVEFNVLFPNHVKLLYNPRKEKPTGCEPLPGIKVRGKPVYLDRTKELPMKVSIPLHGGGKGGLSIRLKMRQVRLSPEKLEETRKKAEGESKNKETSFQPGVSSESQVLLNVHEFFHGFQRKFAREDVSTKQLLNFTITTEQAVYSNIEGLALLRAYREKDKAKALRFFQASFVARQLRHKMMPSEAVLAEKATFAVEGTATYAAIKMAELIKEKKYKAAITGRDDPFFFDFKFMKGYIEGEIIHSVTYTSESTFDIFGKCYNYGALQCFLMDRFFPGWKKDFFRGKRTIDNVMEKSLRLTGREKKAAAGRLKKEYDYDKLYAKHDPAVKRKAETARLVENRRGKKYILDCKKTGEIFVLLPPPSKAKDSYFIGAARLYQHGIRKYVSGQIELSSEDTLLYSPEFHIVEWVDPEVKEGEKGFDFSFSGEAEGIYKNVVFKTKGFTLKAPQVKITEDEEKNEVCIEILTKAVKESP